MLQESVKSRFEGLKSGDTSYISRKHIDELDCTYTKGSIIVYSDRHLCLAVNGEIDEMISV